MHRCCMSPSATDCASSSEIERPQIRPVAYTATMTFLQEGQKATVLQLPAAEKEGRLLKSAATSAAWRFEGDVPGPSSGVSSLAAPRRLNFFLTGLSRP